MGAPNLNVLIVDDEIELAEIMKVSFQSTGHDVELASNGKEALTMLETKKFDVVLSDVRMPVLDGVHLLDELRERNVDDPPVVLMTAYSYVSAEDAFEHGASGVLQKPCATGEIIGVLERTAAQRKERWSKAESDKFQPTGEFDAVLPSFELARKNGILNLARGGMFVGVPSASLPDVGEIVRFSFEFESGKLSSLKGIAQVRWIRPSATDELPAGCGMEFLRLDNDCIDKVIGEIEESKVKAYIPKQ